MKPGQLGLVCWAHLCPSRKPLTFSDLPAHSASAGSWARTSPPPSLGCKEGRSELDYIRHCRDREARNEPHERLDWNWRGRGTGKQTKPQRRGWCREESRFICEIAATQTRSSELSTRTRDPSSESFPCIREWQSIPVKVASGLRISFPQAKSQSLGAAWKTVYLPCPQKP